MFSTLEQMESAGLDPSTLLLHNKTKLHTEQFCCAGCGTMYWATKEYAVLRAKAQVKPACSKACMRKVGGYVFS